MTVQDNTNVDIEASAIGDITEIIDAYSKYLLKNFGHVSGLASAKLDRFIEIVNSATDEEINANWRFGVSDVSQWTGYDDGKTRVIAPRHCKGLAYEELEKAVEALGPLTEDQVEDIIVFVFITVQNEFDSFNLSRIFGLEKEDEVSLLIDTAYFDPAVKTGDEIYLDFEKLANCKKLMETVFGTRVFCISINGKFEKYSSIDDDEDEDDEL